MKELVKIAFNLTIVCVFAGAVLGLVNWGTQQAKEANQHKREVAISMSLLGFGPGNPAPPSLQMEVISRYLLEVDGKTALGYVVPKGDGKELILLSLEGEKLMSMPAPDMASADINNILSQALAGRPVANVSHVEDYQVAVENGAIKGYLITANNQGFKTNIKMMVSLNADFSLRGIAILEHEEDPGLGAEAVEPYFKNQFVGKTAAQLAKIQVVTTPQPDDYRKLLASEPDGHFNTEDMTVLIEQYGDSPIYSITGSTISSKAVTVGVQKAVARFAARLQILNAVMNLDAASATEEG